MSGRQPRTDRESSAIDASEPEEEDGTKDTNRELSTHRWY